MVVSRLLYSLQCAWLNKSQRQQLDGFQARILRRIGGIAPADYSRISNQSILDLFATIPLSRLLLEQQLLLFGKVARNKGSIMNEITFEKNSFDAKHVQLKRRRPKLNWTKEDAEHVDMSDTEK